MTLLSAVRNFPQVASSTLPEAQAAGRPLELESVFREHHAAVFAAAYRVTGNAADAEDVLQTVFLRLARREEPIASVTNLHGYLHRSAVNAALDTLRSRTAARQEPMEDPDAFAAPAAGSDAVLRDWLAHALKQLNPKHAEMFTLRYVQDLDNQEIAALMNTSKAVVAITLFRVRKQLQRALQARQGARK